MRRVYMAVATVMLAGVIPPARGQDANSILLKLKAQFKLTQITADKSDIVTAGSVLVLHKDRLVMYALSNPVPPQSTYKKGKIARNFGNSILGDMVNAGNNPDAGSIAQRVFVSGEKFWVIGINPAKDGVVFRFYSDPFDDVRYWGELKFQYPKGSAPAADEFLNMITEAVTVEPDDNAVDNKPEKPAAPEKPRRKPVAPAPPPPPEAPPPTKTISLGMTREEVVATFGQPKRIAKLPTKELYFYPDMRVTLVGGKVSDVDVTPAN